MPQELEQPEPEEQREAASLQVDQLQVDQLRRQLDDLNLEFQQLQATLRVTEEGHKQAFQQLQDANQTHRAAASAVSHL